MKRDKFEGIKIMVRSLIRAAKCLNTSRFLIARTTITFIARTKTGDIRGKTIVNRLEPIGCGEGSVRALLSAALDKGSGPRWRVQSLAQCPRSDYLRAALTRSRRRCGAIIFRVPQFFAHPKVPSLSSSPSRRGSPVALPVQLWVLISREKERNVREKGGEEEKLLDEQQRGQNKTTLKTIYEMRK
ncbi:hypothetical protein DBV15_10633 [Temnothorax longispinosus]|uniref:Uncharacterized protein n=1 Tax=Temnothorax longispinosus TaxID=300112 RepID=A0A4S2KEN4_9HYME|nr:hypothetical protein DBV15_10633 [Temnothorax longispinosus]